MAMKNFTVTFTLNDQPSKDWAEAYGITGEESRALLKNVFDSFKEYMQFEHEKGNDEVDASLLIIWMLENDRIDPRAFMMIFNHGLFKMTGGNPLARLMRQLRKDSED